MSDNQIAEHVGVSDKTVAKYREDATSEIPKIKTRTVTRGGTTYEQDTANIGKSGAKGDDEPIDVDSQPATPAEATSIKR